MRIELLEEIGLYHNFLDKATKVMHNNFRNGVTIITQKFCLEHF